MAPERFDEEPGPRMSPASDIFAWGAVITFAGTGRTPFAGDSPPATAMRILTQPPVLEGLPMPLRLIVARTLAKDPAERPTARELLDLLLAVGEPGAAAPPVEPHRPARRFRRLSVAALALVVLFVAGLVGHSLLPGSDAAVPLSVGSPVPSTAVTGKASATPDATGDRPSAGSPDTAARPSSTPSRQPTPSSPAASSASVNTSGRNLALDGTATASSMEGPGSGRQASYAVDGDPGTRWGSGFSDPRWLQVDLGARWQISEIRLNWENAHATAYRVELSTDGTTWKSVYSTRNGQAGETTVKVAKLPARFVRNATGSASTGPSPIS
jgi:serine/threonine protein kinase